MKRTMAVLHGESGGGHDLVPEQRRHRKRQPPGDRRVAAPRAGGSVAAQIGPVLIAPVTIKLKFDELEPIAKDSDVSVKSLWLVAQASGSSPTELGSMGRRPARRSTRCSVRYCANRLVALKVPAVRRRIEDVQRARAASCQEGASSSGLGTGRRSAARGSRLQRRSSKAVVEIPPSESSTRTSDFSAPQGLY